MGKNITTINMRLKIRKVIRQIKKGIFAPVVLDPIDPQDRRRAHAPMMIR
jgi:hypothetical protein